MFSAEKRAAYEEHHRKISWAYYATLVLGFWLIAAPPTFGYQVTAMVWNDILCGLLLVLLSYFAIKPYKLWAQWGIIFLGVWLFVAPLLFWTKVGAGLLNDYLVATLVVSFGLIIPRQPGIKLYAEKGPNVPPGWTYNPSAWSERVPVIFFAWVGFFVARYMGAFQFEFIDTAWDPFFGDGTRQVLTSNVSESFPVSDAMLGAFSYILDILMGYAGGIHRWRTMPWVVIIFGILIIPLGVVSITLVILQPVAVGYWCSLCLTSAFVSLIMIPFTLDEVLASAQLLKREKNKGRTFWQAFWFGGTMQGGEIREKQDPANLLDQTVKTMVRDLSIKPWNLFVVAAVGLFTMASPGLLEYSGLLADSSHLAGAIIVTFAVISMSEVARSLRFLNIIFGLWLIVSPWLLGSPPDTAIWSSVISGLVLIILAFPKGIIEEKRGGFDQYIK